ncbi:eEF1A lysine and N-terminal methyltransferase homolog [Cloeon dipterum]|uniref:eEF1A lysine and N-terminal methyltransferase homolog n=1 Tax=Cloeon dipterum TaxID=197152 RepID=UPI00321FEBED
MNLLPKAKAEFGETSYWENFFKKRGSKAFDWYGEYPELCSLISKYIKPKDDILVIGCGNSTLSASMYDVGYRNITNIDTSSVVIRQMRDANAKKRPSLVFEQKDATNTEYPDSKFSVVLDKGTLDALMPDDEETTLELINKLFKEIDRVLRVGGRYICVSLLQPHILAHLLERFPVPSPDGLGWPLRICHCPDASATNIQASSGGPSMPVFFVVCTKFKSIPGMKSITEISLSEQHLDRIDSEGVKEQVVSLQQASLVAWKLRTNKQFPGSGENKEDDLSINLHKPGEEKPRFTLKSLDRATSSKGAAHKFVAFVVPQGRETEYLFCSPEGQKQLISMTGAERLLLVFLHRGQVYESMNSIREELASTIVQFAPQGIPENIQIPFLSCGNDMGHREIIYEGHSEFSGDFVVEDVECDDGEHFRKLVFLSNQGVVQSEALLRRAKNKNKQGNLNVDVTYLACDHHRLMCLGLAQYEKPDVLIIGLGGGGLCSFIARCFSGCHLTAVEIDSAMLMVAESYFGLTLGDHLKVEIGDGLQYIKNGVASGLKYDAVLFDVDNKDTSIGMSCPPKEFVTEDMLKNVKNVLSDDGVFILNLVCRDPTLKTNTLQELMSCFKSVASVPLKNEVNDVIFCSVSKSPEELVKWIKDSARKANALARKCKAKDQLLKIDELNESLSLIKI